MNRGRIISIAAIYTPVAIGLAIALAAPRCVLLGCNNNAEVNGKQVVAHPQTLTLPTFP